MVVTSIDQLDPIKGIYTYEDYLLWKFEERVELIKGNDDTPIRLRQLSDMSGRAIL